MQLQPHWLKRSVLLPVALGMIVSGVIVLVVLLAVLSLGAKQEFTRDYTTLRAQWDHELTHHGESLRLMAEGLLRDSALQQALQARDPLAMQTLTTPLFAHLQDSHHITCMALFGPAGELLLGLHHTGTDSPALQQALASGLPQSGLEFDPAHNLRLVEVMPWYQDRQLLGYVLLGTEFSQVAGTMTQLFGMQHLVVLPPATANDRSLTVTATSIAEPPLALLHMLRTDRIAELEQGMALERAEKWYFAGAIPLATATHTPLGWLVTLRDVSDVRAALLLGVGLVILVTATVLTVLLFVLHRITCQAEQVLTAAEDDLQQTLDQLEAAHAEWVESFDAIEQPIFIHDQQFRVIRANRAYALKAGLSFHDLLGRPYWEVFPRHDGPLPGCLQAMQNGGDHYEEEVRLPDGQIYISRSFPIRDPAGSYRFSIHVLQNVTELEHITNALRHEMRARRTITASNQALIHATDEDGLLQEVCRIATQEGGYQLAWAAYTCNDAEHSLRPVGAAGITLHELRQWPLSWSETAARNELSAYAVRSGKVQVAQNLLEDSTFPASTELAQRFGFASALAIPLRTDGNVFGLLFIAAAVPHTFTEPELEILRELAGDLAFGINALRGRQQHESHEQAQVVTLERMKGLLGNTVLALSAAVEARVPHAVGHQQRVMDLAMAIGRSLGWEEERVEALGIAALVHDVGNTQVPAEILSKPGKLSAVEYELVKNHSHTGYEILSTVDFPWPIAEMVLQHHELLDGSGYPSGLKNGAILREAQVIGIAGLIEAMASPRPYRPALGVSAALKELERHRGVKYDAQLVDACLELFRNKGYDFHHQGDVPAAL